MNAKDNSPKVWGEMEHSECTNIKQRNQKRAKEIWRKCLTLGIDKNFETHKYPKIFKKKKKQNWTQCLRILICLTPSDEWMGDEIGGDRVGKGREEVLGLLCKILKN